MANMSIEGLALFTEIPKYLKIFCEHYLIKFFRLSVINIQRSSAACTAGANDKRILQYSSKSCQKFDTRVFNATRAAFEIKVSVEIDRPLFHRSCFQGKHYGDFRIATAQSELR